MLSIRILTLACAFLIPPMLSAPAHAQQLFRVGGLTCSTGPRVGLVLGSRQEMQCVFLSTVAARQYSYRGTIRRVGLDVRVTPCAPRCGGVFGRNSNI